MSNFDLEAIRARDRDYNDIFEEQSRMSPDIAHRLVAWPVADRRALLAAYDALAARLAEAEALLRDVQPFIGGEPLSVREQIDWLTPIGNRIDAFLAPAARENDHD